MSMELTKATAYCLFMSMLLRQNVRKGLMHLCFLLLLNLLFTVNVANER